MANRTSSFGFWSLLPGQPVRGMLGVVCQCGKQASLKAAKLLSGHSKSCGCMTSEMQRAGRTTHGHSHLRSHKAWRAMIARCSETGKAHTLYHAQRGIKVHESWLDYQTFVRDMGEPKPGMTLERKDTNRGYGPGNCVWATPAEQARNTRRSCIWTIDGVEYPSLRVAERTLGLASGTVLRWCRTGEHGASRRLRYEQSPSLPACGPVSHGSAAGAFSSDPAGELHMDRSNPAARVAGTVAAEASGRQQRVSEYGASGLPQPEPDGNAQAGDASPSAAGRRGSAEKGESDAA